VTAAWSKPVRSIATAADLRGTPLKQAPAEGSAFERGMGPPALRGRGSTAARYHNLRFVAFAVVSLLGAHPAPARGAGPASAADLCVVRVEDTAAAGSIEVEQPFRYLFTARTFPGSPLVVLKPQRRGIWTLSDDRRFVRITEGTPPRDPAFPTGSPLNDFAVEVHSGRVLGIRDGRGVWALAPGGERFAAHRPEQWPELGFLRTMAYVPAWGATVFGGVEGLFVARDDDPFVPVPGPDGDSPGGVTRVVAVPGRGAALVGIASGRVGLVMGEHGPKRTRWLSPHLSPTQRGGSQDHGPGYVTEVFPLPRPGAFLVSSQGRAHVLSLPPDAEESGEAAIEEVERAPPGEPSGSYRRLAPGTGEYLVYIPVARREQIPAGAGLFRLEGTRFVPVPGGDAATLGRSARFFAVPSRGLVVARAQNGRLFVYRDGALAPVADSGGAGPYSEINDLPLVRRVLVHSLKGLFELTPDLRLVPVPAPVPSLYVEAVAEMPPSGVAAVIAQEGVFAIGPEGGLAPVPGGEAAWSRVAKHVFLPSRSELLFTGHKGLFLLVDRRLSGADACPPPQP